MGIIKTAEKKEEESKRQRYRKRTKWEAEKEARRSEYKARLPRIRLIGVTYHLLVSMTAAVTFGK